MQMICKDRCNRGGAVVAVHGQEFSELKIPYNTVLAADFADLECEASARSVAACAMREQVTRWRVTVCCRLHNVWSEMRFMEKQCGMRENSWMEKKFGLEWMPYKCYIFNKSKRKKTAYKTKSGEYSMDRSE